MYRGIFARHSQNHLLSLDQAKPPVFVIDQAMVSHCPGTVDEHSKSGVAQEGCVCCNPLVAPHRRQLWDQSRVYLTVHIPTAQGLQTQLGESYGHI
jgi:hypothetical protein